MEIFEFYFNPGKKTDTKYETFCFAPTNKKEEKSGHLFLAGEIKNYLPKNRYFLSEIAKIIKKHYYKNSDNSLTSEPRVSGAKMERKANPQGQTSLTIGLEKTNEFLQEQIKKNNVDWLGNFNFVALSLTPTFSLNFTKTGDFKILLLKQGQIYNIGRTFDSYQENSLSFFQNIANGKLNEDDKILILDEEIFNIFENENIFSELALASKDEIKKILKQKRKFLKKAFGFCLLIIASSMTRQYQNKSWRWINPRRKKVLISILILIILLFLGYLLFKK